MDFFIFIIFPVILFIFIFVIIPNIMRVIKKNNEYYSFKTFLEKNQMYDTEYESVTYKNIVEMDFDMNHKQLALYSYYETTAVILDFDEILDFEVTENGNSIISSRTGSTIAGGLLFGELGAMVGASGSRSIDEVCHTLKLKIYTNNISNNVVTLDFLDDKVRTESIKYDDISQVIDEMVGFLKLIKEHNRQEERKEDKNIIVENTEDIKQNNNLSSLKELAELKEKGIITQEEFEETKKKILSKL